MTKKSLKLKDIAIIISPNKLDFRLLDDDIVICRVGKNIGKIFFDEDRVINAYSPNCIILRSSNEELSKILQMKYDEIKKLSKGIIIKQVSTKDLMELTL